MKFTSDVMHIAAALFLCLQVSCRSGPPQAEKDAAADTMKYAINAIAEKCRTQSRLYAKSDQTPESIASAVRSECMPEILEAVKAEIRCFRLECWNVDRLMVERGAQKLSKESEEKHRQWVWDSSVAEVVKIRAEQSKPKSKD